MKKVQKSVGLILAVLLMMTTILAGCGGGNGGSDAIVGKWTLSSVDIGGTEMSLSDLAEMAGGELGDEMNVTFDIKADGTLSGNAMGETAEGTWTKNGDTYTLTVEGSDQEVKLDGGKLVIEEEGMKMILTK
jgi:heat shock protein HslJ